MKGQLYLKDVVTLKLNAEKCTGCRMCTIVCPHQVFELKDKRAGIRDKDSCMECGACANNCEAGAIEVDAGVGCAAGIINGYLRGTEPACDCAESSDKSCC
ncbi:MAG: mercury methylation ferredoxin HgcB [bacterium]